MPTEKTFALKGNIVFTPNTDTFEVHENSYLICEMGTVKGISETEPHNVPIIDYGSSIIIPGMIDLHIHAPQYTLRATGMDTKPLEWLLPEEIRYEDMDYAERAYHIFTEDLTKSPTTRASIFATPHKDATLLLMEMLEASGLITTVGKTNEDRLLLEDADIAADETIMWIDESEHFVRTKPIITPRSLTSCTNTLLKRLAMIREMYDLPVQSHLSESIEEIELAQSIDPDSNSYGDAYNRVDLFGNGFKTIMAHCVHPNDEEIELIKKNNVFVAHCPQSNINSLSGIAPIRKLLDKGVRIGLGTDVAKGCSLSMFKAVTDAVQVSKLRSALIEKDEASLKLCEAFYMATKGGGEFFGKVGSFENGYDADILVLDDKDIESVRDFSTLERLERILYLNSESSVSSKYVKGIRIF